VFSPGGLTADDAARRAGRVAPAIARKAAALAAAAADLGRARLALAPIVGGKATYTRLSPLDTLVLPLGGQTLTIPFLVNSYDATAQISVNVSDYAARDPALIEGARRAVDAARLDGEAGAASVGEQAREQYYEWLRAQLALLVVRRQLAQVESTLTQIRALVDVQRASTADLLRVESQRAQARQAVDQLDAAVALREEQLRLLIGATADEPLRVGEDPRAELPPGALGGGEAFPALADRAAHRRRELAALDAGIHAKDAQRAAEVANLLPRLTAFALVDYGDPSARVFPQQDAFRLTWAAGAQLSWVINDGLVAGRARDRLAAEADALRADRANVDHQIRVEVLAAAQTLTLARRAIEISQQGEKAAEESYRVRRDLFAAARASVVEMVDAETELSRARIAALDARIDLRIALARLRYATGEAR
jgi:outer membrane protein